jgi:hypothetical protein
LSAFVIRVLIIIIVVVIVVIVVPSATAGRAKCTRGTEGAVGIAEQET